MVTIYAYCIAHYSKQCLERFWTKYESVVGMEMVFINVLIKRIVAFLQRRYSVPVFHDERFVCAGFKESLLFGFSLVLVLLAGLAHHQVNQIDQKKRIVHFLTISFGAKARRQANYDGDQKTKRGVEHVGQ